MANDPFSGQYTFGTGPGQWWVDPYTVQQAGGEGAWDQMFAPGGAGISQEMANYLGLEAYAAAHPELNGTDGSGESYNPDSGYMTKALNQLLSEKGLKIGQYMGGPGSIVYQQLFDMNNNPVGQIYQTNQEEDPGNLGMLLGLGMMGGFVGGTGLMGGFSGAPAADGAGGMALQEGAMPAGAVSGGGTAAGGVGAASAAGGTAAGSPGLLSGGGVLGSGLSVGQVGGLLGAAAGALGNGTGLNSATQSVQNKLDPRIAQYLFGADGASGLLGNAAALYNQQMSDPTYMQGFNQMRNVGSGLLSQPIAGNPFTSGMPLGGQTPQGLMQAGQALVPPKMTTQPVGLLGTK